MPLSGLAGGDGTAIAVGEDGYALDVTTGLAVGRHALVLVDRALAGVVAGRSEGQVAVEPLQQPGQILDATGNVLARVESIGDAEAARCRRHQLHQALRPDSRQRIR